MEELCNNNNVFIIGLQKNRLELIYELVTFPHVLTLACSPQHGVQVVELQQNHSVRGKENHSHMLNCYWR